jgi:uncharacterized membrane protein YagU involved in acid resistance
MDLTAACTYYRLTAGLSPVTLLQGIASGWLGPAAFSGGPWTAALGVASHYLIALVWTVVFFAAARTLRWMTRRRILVGLGYGVFVWLVMNLVVLPLSNVRHRPLQLRPSIVGAIILMLCIGLPIATIVGRRAD